MIKRWYSTEEVAKHAGVSLRQLQWWDEQGYIRPDRAPNRLGVMSRRYTSDELQRCACIARLLKSGITTRRALEISKVKYQPWQILKIIDQAREIGLRVS